MNRRGFLKSILALGAAPAIVKAESIMRIWTPPQDVWVPPIFTGERSTVELVGAQIERGFTEGTYVASCWMRKTGGLWEHVSKTVRSEEPPILRITPQGGITVAGEAVASSYFAVGEGAPPGGTPYKLSGREGSYIELGSEKGVNFYGAGLEIPMPQIPKGHGVSIPLHGENPLTPRILKP